MRYGGIVAYTVDEADKLTFNVLPEETILMNVTLSKTSNSLFAESVWYFKINPSPNTAFSSKNLIWINVPSKYTPDVGRLTCFVGITKVPCIAEEDYWIKVNGPQTSTGFNT